MRAARRGDGVRPRADTSTRRRYPSIWSASRLGQLVIVGAKSANPGRAVRQLMHLREKPMVWAGSAIGAHGEPHQLFDRVVELVLSGRMKPRRRWFDAVQPLRVEHQTEPGPTIRRTHPRPERGTDGPQFPTGVA
jgi:cell wall-associated NlpC family hydrolase